MEVVGIVGHCTVLPRKQGTKMLMPPGFTGGTVYTVTSGFFPNGSTDFHLFVINDSRILTPLKATDVVIIDTINPPGPQGDKGDKGDVGPPSPNGTTYLASFGDATPVMIMDLPYFLALDRIDVNVTKEWDGVGASIEIGVVGETDRYFSALDTELTSIATFSKDFLELGPKQIILTINPGTSPNTGKVHIQIATTVAGT